MPPLKKIVLRQCRRSQLYFIAMITKHLLANGEIRYLQQRTLTKQKNLHTLSFYICPG